MLPVETLEDPACGGRASYGRPESAPGPGASRTTGPRPVAGGGVVPPLNRALPTRRSRHLGFHSLHDAVSGACGWVNRPVRTRMPGGVGGGAGNGPAYPIMYFPRMWL